MKEIKIKVLRATVICRRGVTDKLVLTIEAQSPFPAMGYEAKLDMDLARGYGAEYCRTVFGVEPEEIQEI